MWRILLVVLLGTFVGVVVLEVGLCLFTTGRVVALPNDESLYERIPGSEGVWTSPQGEFDQIIHFNSLGLRGIEPDLSKPIRYLILGDSMVEALQVSEEETLCHRLEAGLGTDCTVVNGGLGGYAPLLMRLRLPELLEQIHPQMVLVGLFPNDLEEECRYWTQAEFDETGTPCAVVSPVRLSCLGQVDCFFFRYSNLWRFLHPPKPLAVPESVPVRQGGPMEDVIYPFRDSWTPLEEMAWDQMSKSLGEMERLCREQEVQMHLLIIPAGNQVSPDVWKTGKQTMGFGPEDWVKTSTFQEEIMTRARRMGIPATDLLPSFRAYPNPQNLYFDMDGHWTAAGHQLAAQVLLEDASIEWRAR